MTSIDTEIAIAAKPHDVWRVLTGFAHYGEWNPFITAIDGEAAPGAAITVHIHVLGAAALPIGAEVIRCEQDRELVWRSHLVKHGLFDRDHIIRIEPSATGCLVGQTQTFDGVMAPAAAFLTEGVVRHGLGAMNAALKRRVEAGGSA